MKKLLLILFLFAFLNTNAQYLLDISFNNPTLEPKTIRGFDLGIGNAVEDMALQKDGKVIVVGTFTEYNGRKRNRICRILPNGEIDETFITGTGFNFLVKKVKILDDGKIIVMGNFSVYNNTPCAGFIKLNSNGTVDKSFKMPQNIQGRLNDFLVLPDNKIILGGRISSYDGNVVKGLFRLNADGQLDNSFFFINSFDGEIFSIALQKNKILIGGSFSISLGANIRINHFAKLAYDGASIEIGFNIGGKGFEYSNGSVKHVIVQNDNKILLAGTFVEYNDNKVGRLIRLNENGWLDKKFNNSNSPFRTNSYMDVFEKIYVESDGSIYVSGQFEAIGNTIALGFARLNAQGNIDKNFYNYNHFSGQKPNITCFLQLPSNEFIVAGRFSYLGGYKRNSISSLNSNGLVSNKIFYINKGLAGPITHIIPYKGKYLVAGRFGSYNDEIVNAIILIDENGERDYSFDFSTEKYLTNAISDIKVLKNNQLIIAGIFESNNSSSTNKLIKLNENGSIDETFYIGSTFDNDVYTIDEQADGKLIVGGDFKKIDGINKVGIARLNVDGTIDNSFNSNNNLEISANKVMVDAKTNKIVFSGRFKHPTKQVYINLQALSPNGTIDNTFNSSLFENTLIHGFVKDNNNKFLVYGSLSTPTRGRTEIVRIDFNGNYDGSFAIEQKFYKYGNYVNRVIVLPNNDIMVGFKSPPSGESLTANNSIIRLNNFGVVNTSFKFSSNMGMGESGEMYGTLNTCILLNNNTLLAGGNFNYIDGYYINYLAKLKLGSTATEATTNKQQPNITSKSSNSNTEISPKAKLVFDGVKTKLSNADKNTIAEELAQLKYSTKLNKLILSLDENEASSNDDDEFSPSFELNIYNTDLNKDGNEEVFITMKSSMLMGTEGVPMAFIFMKVNGKFEKVFEGEAYLFRINQNNKSANPEICIADEQKFIKSISPIPGALLVFKDGKYNVVKTKQTTVFKWINIELLSNSYKKAL